MGYLILIQIVFSRLPEHSFLQNALYLNVTASFILSSLCFLETATKVIFFSHLPAF